VFGAVGVLMISAIPSAMAMPGPNTFTLEGSPSVTGSTFSIQSTAPAAFDPIFGEFVRVKAPGQGAPTEALFGTLANPDGVLIAADCDGFRHDGVVPTWELRNGGVRVTFLLASAGDQITVRFGVGAANPVIAGAAFMTPNAGAFRWFDTDTGAVATDNTNVAGGYRYGSCGTDETGISPAPYTDLNTQNLQAPVGGTILGIDKTALLISGVLLNPIWILPVLGLVAGGTFALLRFQVNRK